MTGYGFDSRLSYREGAAHLMMWDGSYGKLLVPSIAMLTCPSWSKGEHLRCSVFARVGSNPTVSIAFIIKFFYALEY